MTKKPGIIAVFCFLLISFDVAGRQDILSIGERKYAERIYINGFSNLYKINDCLYRSEQPHKNGMKELQKAGVHTILNLRIGQYDQRKADDTHLILEHVPIHTGRINYNDIVQSLKIIHHSEKPILVHCLHGSDRTGCIIAAYRMVYENWSTDEAIQEFTDKNFGYHEELYPNILHLLQTLDVELLRRDLEVDK
jgi:tyrosine-protein phosphatase SIW14